jgi:hypothetical protein
MDGKKDESKSARTPSTILDLTILILLLAAGLGVRYSYASKVVFPPLDDPAFYLSTAQNVVKGRGLEIDALWSYQIPFSKVTHPSHEHWMPLTTGLMAAAFALLDTSLRTGQLPGLLAGALLAPLTYLFGRRALPEGLPSSAIGGRQPVRGLLGGNRGVALGAALLIATSATLSYQAASADSSAPFALLAAWALTIAVRPPGHDGSYLGVGLLIALAYLARADGLLLLVAVPLAWWLLPPPPRPPVERPDSPTAQFVWEHWPREEGAEETEQRSLGPGMSSLLDLAVAFAIVVAPWLIRNYLAFGTPLPSSVLSQAWLTDYVDTFNYWSQPTWQTLVEQGWQAILIQRGQALLDNGSVFLLNTFPWGLLALPGLWLLRHRWPFFPPLVYGLLLFFVTALVFPVSSTAGTFYHSLGAVMPFLALAAVYAVQQGTRRIIKNREMSIAIFAAVTAGLLVLTAAQVVITLPAVAERHQAEKEQFEAVTEWLTQNAYPGDVVMTTQPYTLNYASGRPSIVLPGNEPLDSAWEAAQRYGARFLVITQTFGRYPEILHEQPDPRFRLLEATETAEIYEIGGEQP